MYIWLPGCQNTAIDFVKKNSKVSSGRSSPSPVKPVVQVFCRPPEATSTRREPGGRQRMDGADPCEGLCCQAVSIAERQDVGESTVLKTVPTWISPCGCLTGTSNADMSKTELLTALSPSCAPAASPISMRDDDAPFTAQPRNSGPPSVFSFSSLSLSLSFSVEP